MCELLDTVLNGHPGIGLWIEPAGASGLGHRCGWIGAECCRRQEAQKSDDDYDAGRSQRSPQMEIRATTMCWLHTGGANRHFLLSLSGFEENYVRNVHFR